MTRFMCFSEYFSDLGSFQFRGLYPIWFEVGLRGNLKIFGFSVFSVFSDFYLPHMEYEGSIGFVMRKMKILYC
jgi:hypothetical protein